MMLARMGRIAFVASFLLVAATLAGCSGSPPHPSSAVTATTTTARPPVGQPDPAGGANLTAPRQLPVDTYYDEYVTPVALPNPAACDPANPWVCDAYYSGVAIMRGTFEGRAQVWGHLHYNTPGSPVWANEVFTFSGTVAGCGSGAVVITGEGNFTPVPDAMGPLWVRANATIVPGSTSTGLSHLVGLNATVSQDRNFVAPGHLVGTMLC